MSCACTLLTRSFAQALLFLLCVACTFIALLLLVIFTLLLRIVKLNHGALHQNFYCDSLTCIKCSCRLITSLTAVIHVWNNARVYIKITRYARHSLSSYSCTVRLDMPCHTTANDSHGSRLRTASIQRQGQDSRRMLVTLSSDCTRLLACVCRCVRACARASLEELAILLVRLGEVVKQPPHRLLRRQRRIVLGIRKRLEHLQIE